MARAAARLSLVLWVPYGAAILGTVFGMSMYQHRNPSGGSLAAGLASSAMVAVVLAAIQRMRWRLQAERSQAGSWPDTARGLHDRPPLRAVQRRFAHRGGLCRCFGGSFLRCASGKGIP